VAANIRIQLKNWVKREMPGIKSRRKIRVAAFFVSRIDTGVQTPPKCALIDAISALAYLPAMAARQAFAPSDRQMQAQQREQRSKASSPSHSLR
jgi:hypothetical protein